MPRKQPSSAGTPAGCRTLTLAAALCLILPASAWSSALCPGKYHDTVVGTWPSDVAISVPLETIGTAGETRAAAFRSGLQQSGIRIESKSPIRLQLIVSVASSDKEEVVNSGFDWSHVDAALSTSLKDPTLPGSSLSITAVVSDDDKHQNIWAATMQCTIKTDDSEALARDVGADLGQLMSGSIHASR